MYPVKNPFPGIFKKNAEKIIKNEINKLEPMPEVNRLSQQLVNIEEPRRKYEIETDVPAQSGLIKANIKSFLTGREFAALKRFIRDFSLVFQSRSIVAFNKSLENLFRMLEKNISKFSQQFTQALYSYVKYFNRKSDENFKGKKGTSTSTVKVPFWFKELIDKRGIDYDNQSFSTGVLLMDSIENLLRDNLKLPEDVLEQDNPTLEPNAQGPDFPPFINTGSGKKMNLKGGLKKRVIDLLKELLND
jgi:hypothetical protein